MITKMKQILGAAAAMLMLAACGSPKTNLPLEGTQWKLTEMDGKADPAFAAGEDTFNFTLDPSRMMVYGVGACNRLFGPYELEEGNGLDIERLASTMMACPNMDLESRFAKLLEEADKYEIDGDVLTLFDDGKKALVFKGTKAEPLPAAESAYCCSEEGGDCFDRNLLGEKEQGVDLSVGSECEEVGYHRLVGRKRFSGRHAIAGRPISPFEIAERLPECRIVMIGSGGL